MVTKRKYKLNIILAVVTFLSTIMAGTRFAGLDFTDVGNWHAGVLYAVLIMIFISAHEFGHYIASRIHGVDATLPYYIPAPFPEEFLMFGTFGALIKVRSPIPSKKALFDIGVSGPIAGFIVSVIFLIIGFSNPPNILDVYQIHPWYLTFLGGEIPEIGIFFGDTILYGLISYLVAGSDVWLPPMNEVYHFPFLNVGWFGLFVTSLNMLPLGQLDGGHVTYAMFGNRQHLIAKIVWWTIFCLGICGLSGIIHEILQMHYDNSFFNFFQSILFPPLDYIDSNYSFVFNCWPGWLVWSFITRVFIKVKHPDIGHYDNLDPRRRLIGWMALVMLILCFSYNGLYMP